MIPASHLNFCFYTTSLGKIFFLVKKEQSQSLELNLAAPLDGPGIQRLKSHRLYEQGQSGDNIIQDAAKSGIKVDLNVIRQCLVVQNCAPTVGLNAQCNAHTHKT